MSPLGRILSDVGQIYILILVVRAILSWFPVSYNSPLNPVRRVVFTLTEPVLRPFRRLIPPVGGIDISFIVAFFVIEILLRAVVSRI